MKKDKEQEKWFGQYPLWLAAYVKDPLNANPKFVLIPEIWTEKGCLLWQTGTPVIGIEAGVESKELDYNMLNGGEDVFVKYFNRSSIIPPIDPPVSPIGNTAPSSIIMSFDEKPEQYKYLLAKITVPQ